MIVSDEDTTVRQFRLSRNLVRLMIGGALLVVAGFGSAGTAILMGGDRADARLVARNQLLEEQLRGITQQVDTLEQSLQDLTRQDEYYRLLAGLEPLDPEVHLAGIGGPDADSLEANPLYQVDRDAGRRAFSTSTNLSSLLRRAKLLATSWREAEDTLTEKHSRLSATPSIYPTRGYVSSSFSSSRWHPILDKPRPHAGIDIVAPTGTPVVASANGRVSSVGQNGEYGLLVEIDHGHGITTRYAHLSRAAVRVGESVTRGQHIGAVGATGLAVGPHLHYEVLVDGRPANPRRYILDTNVVPD